MRARDLSCVLSLSVFVTGVNVSVCVSEHVSVCLCVYVLLFAKKLTFKTQKSAQVACFCVLFFAPSLFVFVCLFVFVSSQTRHDRFCVFSIFVLFLICPSMLQSVKQTFNPKVPLTWILCHCFVSLFVNAFLFVCVTFFECVCVLFM